MASLNKVFLIGRLTRDPELKYIPSGQAVTNFGMAVSRVYTTQSGEQREETCFVRVVVWGKQAEACSQYLGKGRLVFVEGRLVYRAWETKDGQKRNTLEIRAQRVQFLERPKEPVGEPVFVGEEKVINEGDRSEGLEKQADEKIPF